MFWVINWSFYGPHQSKGICLLDFPFLAHLKPITSASPTSDLPQVATRPGPTSLPGGLIVWTLLPGGVVVQLMLQLLQEPYLVFLHSTKRDHLQVQNSAIKTTSSSTKNHIECFFLLFISLIIKKDSQAYFCKPFTSPNITFETWYGHYVQAVKWNIAIVAFLDMMCQNTVAVLIAWSLSKFARTGYITVTDVKPVSRSLPFGNSISICCCGGSSCCGWIRVVIFSDQPFLFVFLSVCIVGAG